MIRLEVKLKPDNIQVYRIISSEYKTIKQWSTRNSPESKMIWLESTQFDNDLIEKTM